MVPNNIEVFEREESKGVAADQTSLCCCLSRVKSTNTEDEAMAVDRGNNYGPKPKRGATDSCNYGLDDDEQ